MQGILLHGGSMKFWVRQVNLYANKSVAFSGMFFLFSCLLAMS
jgi:hypothetical protein